MTILDVTFDPINTATPSTFTNNNLTVTQSFVGYTRATHGKTTGKWYWEVKLDSGYYAIALGIANKNFDVKLNGTLNTSDWRAFRGYSSPYKYPEAVAYGNQLAILDVIGVALDLDNGTLEFYRNGISMGVSHTNVKEMGEIFPIVGSMASNARVVTINFGATPYAYKIPNGYKTYNDNTLNKVLISSSSGEVKSASNLQYSTTTAIPKMTSNVLPSGKAFSSSIYSTNYDAWYAFDQIENNEGWVSVTGKLTGHVGYMFQTEKTIGKYAIRSGGVFDELPKSWTFEGSNNSTDGTDGTWAVLDFQTSQSWDTRNIDKEFLIENPQPFKYYRVNITEHNGNIYYTGLNELKMYEVLSEAFVKHFTKSEQNFINHGMDKSTELDLSEEISQRVFIEQSPATLGSGKVFKKSIDTSRVPIKQVSIE